MEGLVFLFSFTKNCRVQRASSGGASSMAGLMGVSGDYNDLICPWTIPWTANSFWRTPFSVTRVATCFSVFCIFSGDPMLDRWLWLTLVLSPLMMSTPTWHCTCVTAPSRQPLLNRPVQYGDLDSGPTLLHFLYCEVGLVLHCCILWGSGKWRTMVCTWTGNLSETLQAAGSQANYRHIRFCEIINDP